MCGITGIFPLDPSLHAGDLEARLLCMSDSIQQRGSDDSGAWLAEAHAGAS
ncbi:MAG TPA: hypothetical protein VGJ22_03735 [Anaerolineales bacterium]|jgi:asparagine synthetase B (glutamine-hydrolysing)